MFDAFHFPSTLPIATHRSVTDDSHSCAARVAHLFISLLFGFFLYSEKLDVSLTMIIIFKQPASNDYIICFGRHGTPTVRVYRKNLKLGKEEYNRNLNQKKSVTNSRKTYMVSPVCYKGLKSVSDEMQRLSGIVYRLNKAKSLSLSSSFLPSVRGCVCVGLHGWHHPLAWCPWAEFIGSGSSNSTGRRRMDFYPGL